MKRYLFLALLFIAVAGVIPSAQAAQYTGIIESGSFFGVSAGDTFSWTTTWSGSPSTGWITADSLTIPIGAATFIGTEDENAGEYDGTNSYQFPALHFTSGMLDGVDFFAADISIAGYENYLFAFTTDTPLPEGSADFDFSTFSIYRYSASASYEDYLEDYDAYLGLDDPDLSAPTFTYTEVLSGDLIVPEPSTLLLFGAGLLGLAGVVRKRIKA